jgi:hypothetical protein
MQLSYPSSDPAQCGKPTALGTPFLIGLCNFLENLGYVLNVHAYVKLN